MTDLKKEIAEIKNIFGSDLFQRCYGIAELAYWRDELHQLLSASDEYVYDEKGELWLAEFDSAGCVIDPISITGMVFALSELFFETDDCGIKDELADTVFNLLEGTPTQFYFGFKVFCRLALMEAENSSAFVDPATGKSFVAKWYSVITETLQRRKDELQLAKIPYIGQSENVYVWCVAQFDSLINAGASGAQP